MKKVTCFYLPSCPYCRQATVCLNELIAENPEYGKVEFEYINEMEDPEIADQYDYQANPSMFIGKERSTRRICSRPRPSARPTSRKS